MKTFDKLARGIPESQRQKLSQPYLASSKTPIRVAIVDAYPDEGHVSDRESVHSRAVRQVIRNLACNGGGDSPCAEHVTVRRLSRGKPVMPSPTGDGEAKSRLTLEDLTATIARILDEEGGGAHLILALSVGFDSIKLNVERVDLAPLIKILERASCSGAIVIAPAGNLTGSEGPMIPAAFETLPAPAAAACEAQGIHPAGRSKEREYAPLVYAVGGLDPLDQRLSIGRPWAFPRLAALGMSVSAEGPPNQEPSFPLTGTSMSAAIVAGIASAVWSVKPGLDAAEVMAHVYGGGVPLDGGFKSKRARTEFCLGAPFGPCPHPVHRAFLCGALESVLDVRLGCDHAPSTAYFEPEWPQSKKAVTGTLVPCDVSNCREQTGPVGNQIPNGAVDQGYISSCPGCAIRALENRLSGGLRYLGNVLPKSVKSVVATSYSSLTFGPIGSVFSMTAPATPEADFSVGYTPPANLLYVILTVNAEFQNPDGTTSIQTDYAAVLPPSP